MAIQSKNLSKKIEVHEAKAITSQEHPQTTNHGGRPDFDNRIIIDIMVAERVVRQSWRQLTKLANAVTHFPRWPRGSWDQRSTRSAEQSERIGADRSGCGGCGMWQSLLHWSKLGHGKVQSHWNGEWSEMNMTWAIIKVYKWCVSCPSRCMFTRLTNNCRQGLLKLTDRVNIASAGNRRLDQSPQFYLHCPVCIAATSVLPNGICV